jgi:heme-degrading monooxygenase HmoA
MFAKVSVLQAEPGRIDEGVAKVAELVPWFETMPGYKGTLLLADRQAGRWLGVTFWDSSNGMEASEAEAQGPREQAAEGLGADIVTVENYEVALADVAGVAVGGRAVTP